MMGSVFRRLLEAEHPNRAPAATKLNVRHLLVRPQKPESVQALHELSW